MTTSPESPELPVASEQPELSAPRGTGAALSWPIRLAAALLVLFVVVELNYPLLSPPSELAVFAGLGLFLLFAGGRVGSPPGGTVFRLTGWIAAVGSLLVAGYLVSQSEPLLDSLWIGGRTLGDRAGAEIWLDYGVGALGLLLVLEAARRSVGNALPILASLFLAYGAFGAHLPDWLLPHRGYSLERLIGQAYLQSQGVYGIALRVMMSYVFLFVVLGTLLELTGATQYIVLLTRRLLARSPGGSAKVAVLSSGLMGSLSGSAVANTATTGTFTIPLMRSSGFSRAIAAGVEAAASSGGALVPPVMGAAAYMMLEIVEPAVTYVEILRAAILPASLYYLSLLAIVHLTSQKTAGGVPPVPDPSQTPDLKGRGGQGVLFLVTLGSLVSLLLAGFSVFRSVTLALGAVVFGSLFARSTRRSATQWLQAVVRGALAGAPLVAAAASVGIIIGVVTLTGIGTRFPSLLLPLAQESLLAALLLIMAATLILGMGLPSAVVYLLMATLVGPVLSQLGVIPLAAHFFIFYFGMMAMVTPPVALAAYAASSIAGAPMLTSSWAAFRFALIGFALPFLFVYRPALLWLAEGGEIAGLGLVVVTYVSVAVATWALAVAVTGWWSGPLGGALRAIAATAAVLAASPLTPPLGGLGLGLSNLAGFVLIAAIGWYQRGRLSSAGVRSR